MTYNSGSMFLSFPRNTYFDEETTNKLNEISFQMKLDKNFLINYWLTKNIHNENINYEINQGHYHHAYLIMNELTSQLERQAFRKDIEYSHLVYCYIREDIMKTYEIKNDIQKVEEFQKIIYEFEDNSDLKNWPGLVFRNKREKNKIKSIKKLSISELSKETHQKVNQINQIKNEIEELWKPVIENFDNMTEEEILEVNHKTSFYGGEIWQSANAFYRKKFGR